MSRWAEWGGIILDLCKWKIAVAGAITAILGFFTVSGGFTFSGVLLFFGLLLAGMGSAGANQVQEWPHDQRMGRTRNRPIPAGRVKPLVAAMLCGGLLLAGLAILFFTQPPLVPFLVGIIAVVYNGIYTPLKRWAWWAFLPGGLCGALLPMSGWVAGGGHPLHPKILAIALFLWVWQVPHVMLLQERFAEDYREAGYPLFYHWVSGDVYQALLRAGYLATAFFGLFLPWMGQVVHSPIFLFMMGLSLWLIWPSRSKDGTEDFRLHFARVNLYGVFMLLLIAADRSW